MYLGFNIKWKWALWEGYYQSLSSMEKPPFIGPAAGVGGIVRFDEQGCEARSGHFVQVRRREICKVLCIHTQLIHTRLHFHIPASTREPPPSRQQRQTTQKSGFATRGKLSSRNSRCIQETVSADSVVILLTSQDIRATPTRKHTQRHTDRYVYYIYIYIYIYIHIL